MGVLAQELIQAGFPELVYETEPLNKDSGLEKIFAVRYELLSALVLGSVKELYSEVKSMKETLTSVLEDIKKLKGE